MAKKTRNSQPVTTAQQLGSLIKSARDIMRKDKGLNGDLDRLPMLTWIMFLKFLDDLEQIRETDAKLAGKRLAKPWLRSNLPATFKFIRSQDYKIVFATRLIPIVPFDLVSFVCGALDFRTASVVLATLIGTLPEAYMYAKIVDPSESMLAATGVSPAGAGSPR